MIVLSSSYHFINFPFIFTFISIFIFITESDLILIVNRIVDEYTHLLFPLIHCITHARTTVKPFVYFVCVTFSLFIFHFRIFPMVEKGKHI